MATIKSYTDLEQSKKLAEILPIESADGYWDFQIDGYNLIADKLGYYKNDSEIPCWSLAALLHYLNEIKPRVYTPVLFPSEGRWILQFAEHGHSNVCEMSCDNPNDACYEMIIKLHELNLL